MVVLQGSRVILRPLELNDLSFLYVIENDITLWELSQTKTPFSKEILKNYFLTYWLFLEASYNQNSFEVQSVLH